MAEVAFATAPVHNYSQPISNTPAKNKIARWLMIVCAEMLSAFTVLDNLAAEPRMALE